MLVTKKILLQIHFVESTPCDDAAVLGRNVKLFLDGCMFL